MNRHVCAYIRIHVHTEKETLRLLKETERENVRARVRDREVLFERWYSRDGIRTDSRDLVF